MSTYAKTLLTIIPMVVIFFLTTIGITYYFSHTALTELAEEWLKTRASEAKHIAFEQEKMLQEYGLVKIIASSKKAKLDAGVLMQSIEVGRLGFIIAVTSQGIVTVHPDKASIGRDISAEPWFGGLKLGKGRLTYTGPEHQSLAMYDYFEPWDWFILAIDPEKEVYGTADQMRPYLISLGILVIFAMSLVLMFLTRRLTSPLRLLTAGANRIGQGDLDTRISIRSKDEFGQLAEVFNQMASRLQKTLTALKHREEHFRAIIENSSDIIAILDKKGIISYMSPSVQRYLGHNPKDLIGKSPFDFVHHDDRDRMIERFKLRASSMSSCEHMEFRFRHRDGSWRTVEGIGKNLLDHPAVEGLVINSRDVTARKKIEAVLAQSHQDLEHRVVERTGELIETNDRLQQEILDRKIAVAALESSEQRMRAILRASPVGIGLVIGGKLDWGNEAFFQMVDNEASALLGQSIEDLYVDAAAFAKADKALNDMVCKSEIGEVETRWIRNDGTPFDCIVRAYPLIPDDPAKGQIVVVADISESKRLEEMLQRARKMEAIGTLAGGVAHDLNNILSGIVSYPELLLYQLPEDSAMRGPIMTIHDSGLRAAAIVQDLLTMARRGVAVKEIVNINDIINEQLNTPEFEELKKYHPGFAVDTHLDKELFNVKGSPAHLSKSMMNLISNAAEAMPDGGRIAISTENVFIDKPINGYEQVDEGEYIAIAVSDTGVGMPAAEMERIFEPFYTHKKMGRSGTGLGMAVVWGTIKDHKGYIDVQSTEGKGTTFRLYIPVTREGKSHQGTRVPISQLIGSGETILVVDDAKVQREIAQNILTELGYRVTTIASGEEAVEYLKTHSADLMVLDMIMSPGMDGLDTYRQIILIKPKQKAIIASGFSETARVREAKRVGVLQYIRKPYTIEKIGIAVSEALKTNKALS